MEARIVIYFPQQGLWFSQKLSRGSVHEMLLIADQTARRGTSHPKGMLISQEGLLFIAPIVAQGVT